MKMWIVREQDDGLWLFCEEPIYDKFLQEWFTHKPCEFGCLPTECFPEVTFENSPMEVELKIKKNGLHFSPMFRLLGMIINKDPSDKKRIEAYTKKLIDKFKEEGFDADARVAEDYLKALNGEQMSMATMDEVELKLIQNEN